MTTIYFIGVSAACIPMSKLCQNFGIIQMAYICNIAIALLRVASGLFNNFYILLVFRFFTGIMCAGVNVTQNSIMGYYLRPSRLQLDINIVSAVAQGAEIIVPMAISYFMKSCGWNACFFLSGGLNLLCVVLLTQFQMKSRQELRE